MAKGWKIFWIILIVLVIIGIAFGIMQYYKWKAIWEKITFSKPIPTALDLKGLTLADLVNIGFGGGDRNIQTTLKMLITNDSDTEITFNHFRIVLSYNGQIITQTTDTLYNTTYILPTNGVLPVEDTVNISLNRAGAFLKEKLIGGFPIVGYKVDLSVYGIPIGKIYPIEGSFEW